MSLRVLANNSPQWRPLNGNMSHRVKGYPSEERQGALSRRGSTSGEVLPLRAPPGSCLSETSVSIFGLVRAYIGLIHQVIYLAPAFPAPVTCSLVPPAEVIQEVV